MYICVTWLTRLWIWTVQYLVTITISIFFVTSVTWFWGLLFGGPYYASTWFLNQNRFGSIFGHWLRFSVVPFCWWCFETVAFVSFWFDSRLHRINSVHPFVVWIYHLASSCWCIYVWVAHPCASDLNVVHVYFAHMHTVQLHVCCNFCALGLWFKSIAFTTHCYNMHLLHFFFMQHICSWSILRVWSSCSLFWHNHCIENIFYIIMMSSWHLSFVDDCALLQFVSAVVYLTFTALVCKLCWSYLTSTSLDIWFTSCLDWVHCVHSVALCTLLIHWYMCWFNILLVACVLVSLHLHVVLSGHSLC